MHEGKNNRIIELRYQGAGTYKPLMRKVPSSFLSIQSMSICSFMGTSSDALRFSRGLSS